MWLFALMAHDGLSGVPGIVWGIPLAAAALYLVFYTAYACYEDYYEIQRQLPDGATDASNSCIARAFVCVRRFCCCRAADVNDGDVNDGYKTHAEREATRLQQEATRLQQEATVLQGLLDNMEARANKAEEEKQHLEARLGHADLADEEKVRKLERELAEARTHASKVRKEKGWLEHKLERTKSAMALFASFMAHKKRADEDKARHQDEDDVGASDHAGPNGDGHDEAESVKQGNLDTAATNALFAPPHDPPAPPPPAAASGPQLFCSGMDIAMCAQRPADVPADLSSQ
jgi:hypothetical protein